MHQIENATGLAAATFLAADPEGVETVYAVVKGTFALGPRHDGGEPPLAPVQAPVAAAATHHGQPDASSVRMPADVGLAKPSTDVLLVARAHAPGDHPTTAMDVTLTAGPLRRTARIIGDRVWQPRDGGAFAASDARPFTRMPLVWERAFGGAGDGGAAPDARNPVGVGRLAAAGAPLPNLEDPDALLGGGAAGAAPAPVGFAPVAEHWLPRLVYAGTYDEAWQRSRAPYLPADFDPRFLQLAPPELIAPAYFVGGEPVEVTGVTPGGQLRFEVPRVAVEVTYVVAGAAERRPARLDTVLIEPDNRRVLVTWRAALRCDKRALRVETVHVAAERAS